MLGINFMRGMRSTKSYKKNVKKSKRNTTKIKKTIQKRQDINKERELGKLFNPDITREIMNYIKVI